MHPPPLEPGASPVSLAERSIMWKWAPQLEKSGPVGEGENGFLGSEGLGRKEREGRQGEPGHPEDPQAAPSWEGAWLRGFCRPQQAPELQGLE